MKTKQILLILFVICFTSWGFSQRCVTFDQFAVGTQFGDPVNTPGQIIFTENDIDVHVMTFYWLNGGNTFGQGFIDLAVSCGADKIIILNNLNLYFNPDSLLYGPAQKVVFQYSSMGGYENLGINTVIPCYIGPLFDYAGQCSGFNVQIDTSQGSHCPIVTITGQIYGLLVGGQEFILDSVCFYYTTGHTEGNGVTELAPNYPNPFSQSTTIPYHLASSGHVTITVLNCLGREIRTLIQEYQTTGTHEIIWDGTDWSGNMVPGGLYLYKIKTGDKNIIGKMNLIR